MLVVVVVVFPNWRFLCFRTTFLCHRHSNPASQPVKASTGSELYPGYFRLTYFLPGFFRHSFTTSATVLSGHFFTHRLFFTLRSFTKIFRTVCDSDTGRNTPSRILLCACPHIVVPFG